jgi:hypothetical protein
MAQIFISHSQRDDEIISFFLKAFAGTNVKPILQEFEKEPPERVTAGLTEQNIQKSNAVFVLLSENVENLKHTRDWINWECGTARNKQIWVFEPFESLYKIRVMIPRLNHYVRFVKNDDWRKYLRSIIESYDDSNVVPALSAGAGIGALLNEEDRVGGAAVGLALTIVGLLLNNQSKPSFGYQVRCPLCPSNYSIHMPDGTREFRCPNCNTDLMNAEPPRLILSTQRS